jgi:type I restriction enzyme S subunit
VSWTRKPLIQVADLCLGKMLDEKKNKGDLMPYLANVNVRWGSFDLDNLRVMRFEAHELERYRLRNGDIVMCEGGEPGRCAIWRGDAPEMMIQKALHRIRPGEELDYRFLFYVFLWMGRSGKFTGLFTGSTIKHLPGQNLAKIQIAYPSRLEQERIAEMLSAYDDLIENNRRRIALLEESARLLYREWFVHLRFPGHEHVEVVDGLPEGWGLRTIADMFVTTSGGTPSRANPEYFDGATNWVKTQELDDLFIFDTEEHISESAIKNSAAKIFPAGTLLVSIYGGTNIGRTGLLAVPAASNQACVALMPKKNGNDVYFAQKWLQENKDYLVGLGQGAAQTNISQQTLRSQAMLVPGEGLLNEFTSHAQQAYQQIANLCLQNRRLREARDLLLPRLMSGEIQV